MNSSHKVRFSLWLIFRAARAMAATNWYQLAHSVCFQCKRNNWFISRAFRLAFWRRCCWFRERFKWIYLRTFAGFACHTLISFQLNRFLLIYWILVAVLRIILQTLLLFEIFIYDILQSSSYVLLYTLLEVLDYGEPHCALATSLSDLILLFSLSLPFPAVLIASFFLVVSLYKQLKQRDQNDFTRLNDDVWWWSSFEQLLFCQSLVLRRYFMLLAHSSVKCNKRALNVEK